MSVSFATFIWLAVGAYLAVGAVVAVVGVVLFMRRIEPYGAPVPLRVRLVLLPGMIALWPLILARIAGRKPVEDST